MSFLFFPLVISLGICLIPVWLLRQRKFQRARDYFIASQPTAPDVMRNSSVAYPLRIATFAPFFIWGASGDLWPAIAGAACFALGVHLIYVLRRPLFAFLDRALSADASMTVHAFIAKRHGKDARVRLLASGLTLVALTGLITAEAFATATLVKPAVMENAGAVYLVAAGMLLLAMLYTVVSGNSGVMHSVQLQLGIVYLGLFGSVALLLYFLVSDVSPLPPAGKFAVVFVAAACAFILYYRRSKYVDTTAINRSKWDDSDVADGARPSSASRMLSRLEKILNPAISVLVVLVIVLIGMEFFAVGVPVMLRDGIAALQTGPDISAAALLAIVLLSLLYPLVDVVNWQKLAAIARDTESDPIRRSATIARTFKSYAVEVPLLWLLMCMFGAIAVAATETPAGRDVLQIFIGQLAAEPSLPADLAISFLVVGLFTMALSAMSSMLSASLWILRYDMLPALWPDLSPERTLPGDEAIASRRVILTGCGFCAAAFLLVLVADMLLGFGFTGGTFLALIFACCCAQLALAPLVLAPLGLAGKIRGTVSARWALVIVAVAAASGIAAVIVYLATGAEPWLWSRFLSVSHQALRSLAALGFAARSPQMPHSSIAVSVVTCEQ